MLTYNIHIKKAFTLIELLVTISIIGILAGIVSVNVGNSQDRARDAKRKSDISAIKTAIEMYKDGNGGNPIGVSGAWWGEISNNSPFDQLLSYLSLIPSDPKTGWKYYYGKGYNLSPSGDSVVPSSDATKFVICSKLENENDSDYKSNITNPESPNDLILNYCVSGV